MAESDAHILQGVYQSKKKPLAVLLFTQPGWIFYASIRKLQKFCILLRCCRTTG
jgi:hypothetical protein